MGGGIEQLLMTATVLMTTGNEGTLFLEEPESHLHAGAQRYLIERFYDGDRQVFVTTHSPTFVNLSRPRSFYQVTYAGGRTAVDRLGEADSLGAMLEDIGARNSDVLLSDAVLFVEGPSDRDVLYAWSKTLGMSLEESNITVLPMDGGDHADRKARVRSEILEGISERAPIPHLLVLDSDERSPAEIKKLQQGLGDKIYLLERREIENDLLVPRAILTALRLKHTSDAPVLERIELACTEDVQALIDTTAESLYGVVLIKRIRATLEGLKGGLLPRDVAESLAPQAHRKDLARLLRGRIRSRVDEHIAGLDIDTTVRSEREAVFARNMRNALPHASFIGFTGTPLMAGEEKTREVFGDYISIYNFRQSVEDGATVPLYYENRIPELQLTNDALNEDLDRVIDEAMLDERQEQRLQREFNREYQLITREKRLEKVAEDLVNHFMGRGQRGKAMVVSIDKATALRMYDKVQKHWLRCLENLKDQLANASSEEERERLAEKISYMETTDMAVVLSQGQNEVEDMMKKGLDIRPHRERMIREDLDTKFKDSDDPFRIVFVCAMWMTGFDAPSVNTIYLDKPMRNHTLMQTIARANRVFGDKQNGLIVDYIGVFRNLEQALAIYGVGGTDGPPVKDKEKLLEALRDAVEETTAFLRDRGVEPQNILDAEGFDLGKLLNEAQEGIVESDESKRGFLALSANVARLYKAILPDPEASEFGPFTKLLSVLTQRIRNLDPEVDISGVMEDINKVLDESITARSFVIPDSKDDEEPVDLSQIDFEALRMRFEHGRKQTEAERLRGQVNSKLRQMVRFNKTRTDYQEQLQRLIDKYNAGSLNIDLYFKALIKIAQELDQEDQRAISEGLSEEELAVFDILTKPEISVTDQEKEEVKRIARDLLEILKREKLVLDWRKRQQARASVRVTVLDELDKLPPAYTDEMYQSKSELIYQHIYDNYYGQGRSVYAQAS